MPRVNNFVIPTEDGDLILHITPGPCSHEEHWIDPLQLGFRDGLKCHMGFHSIIGLLCVLVQLASKTYEFTWYGRLGLGTWAGAVFFVTCVVGSYATQAELPPRAMRSWLVVYLVFSFFSAWIAGSMSLIHGIYGNLHVMQEWQHRSLALLGAIEFFFCLIEITLVMYRLCTSSEVVQAFDFHVLVEYTSDGQVTTSRQIALSEVPPPSYEQLYLEAVVDLPQARNTTRQSTDCGPACGSEDRANDGQPNQIPLAVISRPSTQTLLTAHADVSSTTSSTHYLVSS